MWLYFCRGHRTLEHHCSCRGEHPGTFLQPFTSRAPFVCGKRTHFSVENRGRVANHFLHHACLNRGTCIRCTQKGLGLTQGRAKWLGLTQGRATISPSRGRMKDGTVPSPHLGGILQPQNQQGSGRSVRDHPLVFTVLVPFRPLYSPSRASYPRRFCRGRFCQGRSCLLRELAFPETRRH